MRMKTFYHELLKVGILEVKVFLCFKLYAKLKSVKRILKSKNAELYGGINHIGRFSLLLEILNAWKKKINVYMNIYMSINKADRGGIFEAKVKELMVESRRSKEESWICWANKEGKQLLGSTSNQFDELKAEITQQLMIEENHIRGWKQCYAEESFNWRNQENYFWNEEWPGTRDRWILYKVFSIKLGRPIVGEDVSEQLNHIMD